VRALSTARHTSCVARGGGSRNHGRPGNLGPPRRAKLPNGSCSGRIVTDVVVDFFEAKKRLRQQETVWGPPPIQKTLALAEEFRRNPPVQFDVAGAGDGVMEQLVRHRQPKGTETDRLSYTPPRRPPTRPRKGSFARSSRSASGTSFRSASVICAAPSARLSSTTMPSATTRACGT
jgi:hypothetical protein